MFNFTKFSAHNASWAWSSCDDNAICYVHSVLQMMYLTQGPGIVNANETRDRSKPNGQHRESLMSMVAL